MSLLTCIQTRDANCELLFALTGSSVDALIGYVGYANAAGFLMSRGFPVNKPPENAASESNIDLMTGRIKEAAVNPWENMSEEERNRESERLFVLFDRLNKTGVFEPINPLNPESK